MQFIPASQFTGFNQFRMGEEIESFLPRPTHQSQAPNDRLMIGDLAKGFISAKYCLSDGPGPGAFRFHIDGI